MFKSATTRLTNSASAWTRASQSSMFTRAFSSMQAKAAVQSSFRASDLQTQLIDVRKIKPTTPEELVFGRLFTDHMLSIDWSKEGGWEAP